MTEIFTIGYGGRQISEFVELLKKYGIEFLIDVRTKPYSRHNPDFSRNELSNILASSGIRYVFMGDTLGGRPEDPDCYTEDGKVDYEKCSEKDFYLSGITRLKKALAQNLRVVLMCSERKPQDCHRSKLIGETLSNEGTPVIHIDEQGKLKPHAIVINTLLTGLGSEQPVQLHLFNDEIGRKPKLTSRNSYKPRNQSKDQHND